MSRVLSFFTLSFFSALRSVDHHSPCDIYRNLWRLRFTPDFSLRSTGRFYGVMVIFFRGEAHGGQTGGREASISRFNVKIYTVAFVVVVLTG